MKAFKLQFSENDIEKWAQSYKDNNDPAAMNAGSAARSRGHLEKSEFISIAHWKSPRPLKRYKDNSEESVKSISRRAFGCQNDVEAIVILTELDGVRVRTASAILHLCTENRFPLMDVRAFASLGVSPSETETWDDLDWLQHFSHYAAYCRALSKRTGHSLRKVDQALWAFDKHSNTTATHQS